jgi:hypothetical protein
MNPCNPSPPEKIDLWGFLEPVQLAIWIKDYQRKRDLARDIVSFSEWTHEAISLHAP